MPRRLCLIDDDFMVREALVLGLRDAGFEVHAVPGAAAGFDLAQRMAFDAIITDMNMPGTHGAQFIPEARRAWPDTPIIAISGQAMIEGRNFSHVAHALGADAALAKPFRVGQLIEAVDKAIDARSKAPD